MGAAEVSTDKWLLLVSGLVEKPYTLTLDELRRKPSRTITAFHECYGSPLQPPTKALWRVGNVTWTGVPLNALLAKAKPKPEARFIWSEGLDRGEFAGVKADRYQKDLPMEKALNGVVLVAYEMNSQPLSKNRGGPVRLVIPGWFGTNSTKWLCKLSVEDCRAPGPFTTTFYNESDSTNPMAATRPIWRVQPNSMIVHPAPKSEVAGPRVAVEGWAWSDDGIDKVSISADGGKMWTVSDVDVRQGHSWQRFKATLELDPGPYTLMARATSIDGVTQPLSNARNHAHSIHIMIT